MSYYILDNNDVVLMEANNQYFYYQLDTLPRKSVFRNFIDSRIGDRLTVKSLIRELGKRGDLDPDEKKFVANLRNCTPPIRLE